MKQRAPAAMPGSGFLGWLLLGLLAILLSGMAAHSGGAVVRLRSGALASHRAGDADRLRIVVAKDGRAAGVAREIETHGGRVLRVLANHVFLVAATSVKVAGIVGIRAQLAWPRAARLGPEVMRLAERAGAAGRQVAIVLQMLNDGRAPASLARLDLPGVTKSWVREDDGFIQVGLRAESSAWRDLVEVLESLDGLAWADVQPAIRLRNAASAWRCQSGLPQQTPIFDHGIRGQGQVIGILDTGIDIDSCYFADDLHGLPAINDGTGTDVDPQQRKVLAVDFYWDHDLPNPGPLDWDNHGHGTHVAGSAAGDRLADGLHEGDDGMAPEARLVLQDGGFRTDVCSDLPGLGCPVQPLGPVLQQAYDQGVRIHSDSWGDEEEIPPFNRYTERTADVDRFTWEHKDFLAVFAAGNSGPGDDTVGSPATGKNVIAVGATLHGDREPPCVVPFSSRGWTQDGRIKPDVVAPGDRVESAGSDHDIRTNNCTTVRMSGTSMACPTVAGLAALVRQYFAEGFYPTGVPTASDAFEPTAALVKATLIGSAVDLNAEGCTSVAPVPSRDQGWGMVQLDRALYFPGDATGLLIEDAKGQFHAAGEDPVQRIFRVNPPGPLKVVLVWTDPPSSSLAAVNLVNDLDLTVSGPSGTYRGNVFGQGRSEPGGAADRVNNVEVVYLPGAAAGTWAWKVEPHAVNLGPQGFAVVVTGPIVPVSPRRSLGSPAPRRLAPVKRPVNRPKVLETR